MFRSKLLKVVALMGLPAALVLGPSPAAEACVIKQSPQQLSMPKPTKPAQTKPAQTKPAQTKPAQTKLPNGGGGSKQQQSGKQQQPKVRVVRVD